MQFEFNNELVNFEWVDKLYRRFIDQVWGQDGWILAKWFVFCKFMDQSGDKVHKRAKSNKANTQPFWPHVNDSLCGKNHISYEIQRLIPSGQDSAIFLTQDANYNAGFSSFCPLTKLAI